MLTIPPGVRGRHALFAALLVVAILVNIVQFRTIDQNTSRHFAAIYPYSTPDIVEIGYLTSQPFREMYGACLALAEVAPGSRVIILGPSRLTRHEFVSRLYGYGEVAGVAKHRGQEIADVLAPDGGTGFDPLPFVVARGDGGPRGAPWLVAIGAPGIDFDGDPEQFLPAALAGGRPGEHRGPAREFLFLEWPQPLPGSAYEFQDLLVETTLLPAAIREMLP